MSVPPIPTPVLTKLLGNLASKPKYTPTGLAITAVVAFYDEMVDRKKAPPPSWIIDKKILGNWTDEERKYRYELRKEIDRQANTNMPMAQRKSNYRQIDRNYDPENKIWPNSVSKARAKKEWAEWAKRNPMPRTWWEIA